MICLLILLKECRSVIQPGLKKSVLKTIHTSLIYLNNEIVYVFQKEEQRMGKETPQISSKTPIEEFARTAQYMKPRKEVLPVGKVDLKVITD